MSTPRSRGRISEIVRGVSCKMGMSSFRCYGNSDLGEMYPI